MLYRISLVLLHLQLLGKSDLASFLLCWLKKLAVVDFSGILKFESALLVWLLDEHSRGSCADCILATILSIVEQLIVKHVTYRKEHGKIRKSAKASRE